MVVDLDTIRFLWPEVILVLMAAWIYLGGTIHASRDWWTWFSLATYAVAAFTIYWKESPYWMSGSGAFASGPIVVDYLGYVVRGIAVCAGVLFTLLALRGARRELASEYLATLMLLVVGLMLVARANDLVLLFLSLELISIPTYVLLFLGRRDRATSEATVKYFFLSILASALFLYGMSFAYGMAGTTTIIGAAGQASLQQGSGGALATRFAVPALVLLFAGLGFKIAAVPFHFYAPDVYQGASNLNAGLLAVMPKLAGVVALVRLIVIGLPQAAPFAWQMALVLAILTMTIGNVSALWQGQVRRLMAYSSVAHAGYLLIGLSVALAAAERTATTQGGTASTLFYVFVYAVASLGTFAALAHLGGEERELDTVDELAGLGWKNPWMAGSLAICLFSLAGIPPLAGFWGKLTLFLGAVESATNSPATNAALWFSVLAVAGAINAAIAAAYYLRVIAVMYFRSASQPASSRGGWGAATSAYVCAAVLVAVGLFPQTSLDVSRRSEVSGARPPLELSAGRSAPASSGSIGLAQHRDIFPSH